MAALFERATNFSLLPLFAHQLKFGNFSRGQRAFLVGEPASFRASAAVLEQFPPGHRFHPQASTGHITIPRHADSPQ